MRIGIHVYLLPSGPFDSQMIPSDFPIPAKTDIQKQARLRARVARRVALKLTGFADPMPIAPCDSAVPGGPINTVEIIADPLELEEPAAF